MKMMTSPWNIRYDHLKNATVKLSNEKIEKRNDTFFAGAYTEQYGQVMSVKEVHTCAICGNQFNHTKTAIQTHVHRVHQLDLLEYYDLYVLNNPNPVIKTEAKDDDEDTSGVEQPPAKRVKTRRSDGTQPSQLTQQDKDEEEEVTKAFKKWVNKCRCDLFQGLLNSKIALKTSPKRRK